MIDQRLAARIARDLDVGGTEPWGHYLLDVKSLHVTDEADKTVLKAVNSQLDSTATITDPSTQADIKLLLLKVIQFHANALPLAARLTASQQDLFMFLYDHGSHIDWTGAPHTLAISAVDFGALEAAVDVFRATMLTGPEQILFDLILNRADLTISGAAKPSRWQSIVNIRIYDNTDTLRFDGSTNGTFRGSDSAKRVDIAAVIRRGRDEIRDGLIPGDTGATNDQKARRQQIWNVLYQHDPPPTSSWPVTLEDFTAVVGVKHAGSFKRNGTAGAFEDDGFMRKWRNSAAALSDAQKDLFDLVFNMPRH